MDGDPLHVPVGKAAPVALDPIARGKRVFEATCTTCHQSSGLGVPSTYPPLAGSEWVTGDPETLVRIVLDGLEGPVSVGGHQFNGIMPAWKTTLDDKRLAAVASYIRASWGNQATPIEPAFVQRVRGAMATRTRAWTFSDLSHARDEGK
jgi:mono/diheme cytochrome c family protein